ncbi:MAG: hypothetical protein ACI4F2_02860 [Acutalibacteraceae bacterium]
MKKFMVSITALLLVFLFAGCSEEINKNDSCKILNLSSCATDKGIYYLDQSAYIKFFDYKSGKNVYLCSKPECAHNDEDCYANSNAKLIFAQDSALYIIDYDNKLVKRNSDGSNSSVIMSLCYDYNSSSDSMAYPTSGVAVGNNLYLAYDATVLNSENGEENKKAVLTCVDMKNHSETIITESVNSQFSIIDCKDEALYYLEYKSTADGELYDVNKVKCVLNKMTLADNSVSVIYEDSQIDFNYCGHSNGTIYFYKNNDPKNELYKLDFNAPTPNNASYKTVYNDDRGNIIYNYSESKYMLEKDGNLSELPLDIIAAFEYETEDGLVFTCIEGNLKGENGGITEQDKFYVTKDDFYKCKNYYLIK